MLASGVPVSAETVTLVYTTDTHGYVATNEETLGLDLVAGLAKHVPNPVLLDVGDFLHGTPLATLTQGRDIVALMKRVGYVAAAVGNHEFDYGLETLEMRVREAASLPRPMQMLTANVAHRDGRERFAPWTIVEIAGIRLGIFGLTTPDTKQQATPAAVADLCFLDPAEAARRCIRELRQQNCDIVVALAHLETAECRKLAAAVPGIDIMLCGHSHVVVGEKIGDTLLASSGEYGRQIGLVAIARRPGGQWDITDTRLARQDAADIARDDFVALATEVVAAEQRGILSEVVAHTDVDLVGRRPDVRIGETNLGNLAADALLAAANADFAVINGGNIRASIRRGAITKGDILTVFPFANTVVAKEVTGAQLKDILEWAFARLPEEDGRFPQVAGMTLRINKSAAPGRRVAAVADRHGHALDPNARYLLTTNDFLASGGDGYPHLADLPIASQPTSVEEALISHLARGGAGDYAQSEPQRILYDR